jgi:hypothetical protein
VFSFLTLYKTNTLANTIHESNDLAVRLKMI